MKIIRMKVPGLDRHTAAKFEETVGRVAGVESVETWPGQAEIHAKDEAVGPLAAAAAKAAGFDGIELDCAAACQTEVRIANMTCRSCELMVERKFKKIPGVRAVDVSATTGIARITHDPGRSPDLAALDAAVRKEGYAVATSDAAWNGHERPSLVRVIAVFVGVLIVAKLFERSGLVSSYGVFDPKGGFWAALVLGLVAGSSSCMAVAGGLLLSSSARWNEAHKSASRFRRFLPVAAFVGSRTAAYVVFGGLIGLVGRSVTPSVGLVSFLLLLVSVFMIIMGLEMVGIAPSWLLALLPRPPKALGRHIVGSEDGHRPLGPALLGAATFFLPCGFTQTLQVYALTAGSFRTAAIVLGGFALGTAPALLLVGFFSNAVKGKAGRLFRQVAGAFVVVMALSSIASALTLAGFSFKLPPPNLRTSEPQNLKSDPNVVSDGETQVIRLKLIDRAPYYEPSDRFTVVAGKPVRVEVDGRGYGCRTFFQIPKFGISKELNQTATTVEFTPTEAGTAVFSCGMGMYRGAIDIVNP